MNFPTDHFGGFDSGNAAGFGDFGGFDSANGVTHVPAGVYVATIERGNATRTKTGKDAYQLCFKITDGPHVGFTVWEKMTFGVSASLTARFRPMLAQLGLTTVADLLKPFPPIGRTITCKILVSVREYQGQTRNNVERFEVVSNEDTATNPFAVPLPTPSPDAQGKGQTP